MKKFPLTLTWLIIANLSTFTGISYATTYHYKPGKTDIIGNIQTLQLEIPAHSEINLDTISQHYNLSYHELIEANPGLYKTATNTTDQSKQITIIIPSKFILPPKPFRTGLVVNLAELRLYYFLPKQNKVITYPVGLGRLGWTTPLMQTQVIRKKQNPTWYAPLSIRKEYKKLTGKTLPRVMAPGPNNPLGSYALYLQQKGYLLHGNSDENSIGKFISSGCIRLYNQDIKQLFAKVPIGTPVSVINYSIKAGVRNNQLYVEAHHPVNLLKNQKITASRAFLKSDSVKTALKPFLEQHRWQINFITLRTVIKQRLGFPIVIGKK